MKRRFAFSLALWCSLVLPFAAKAVTVYSTGFEPANFNLDTLSGQRSWNSDIGPASNIVVQSAVVQTGAQAVGFSASGAVNFTRALRGALFDTASSSQKFVDLKIGMYLSSGGTHSEWRITGGNGNQNFIGLAYVTPAGRLRAFGAIDTDTGIDVTRDVWHTYDLIFNFSANTFELLYDGATAATNQPFADTSSSAFGDVRLEVVSPKTDMAFFDNLSVTTSTVPEPGTLSVLGAGMAMIAGKMNWGRTRGRNSAAAKCVPIV